MQEAQTAVCTAADLKYSLCVYKNPKVGHKPPRVVPMLTKCVVCRKRDHPTGGAVAKCTPWWRRTAHCCAVSMV